MSKNTLAPERLPKTPPRLQNPHLSHSIPYHATPRKDRLASVAYRPGTTLDKRREANLEDLDPIPKVSMDFFRSSVMSWSNADQWVSKVEGVLKKQGCFTDDGRWKEYATNPSGMTGNEDVVFSHLDDIFKKIIEATLTVVNKGRKKTKKVQSGLKFEQKPHVAPCGERDNATRPDAGAVLIDPVTLASILAELHTDSWFALAIPGEFKKKFLTETILDNVRKIMWSAKHILSDDPARRHVFAFTIDDTLMKLWFMSRSHIMVTEPFCFNSRPRELIRAISTFSLAKPEQLGFDSSISQVEIEETVQYKISLNGKVYVTICPLADYRADSIQGRSTRVWLVHP
ncbi:hypothetical protein DFH06DRAFT_1114004, partial [Mycena polygramma]